MNLNGLRYLVVGSGFWGSVIAERIASFLRERVLMDYVQFRNFIEAIASSRSRPPSSPFFGGVIRYLLGSENAL